MALAFLLGAFLTGGASGFAAGRSTGTARKDPAVVPAPSSESPYSNMARELARDLNLSDDQTAVVDSIFRWRKERYDDIMLPVRPALGLVRDSARALIEQRLDATQREAFHNLLKRTSSPPADSAQASKER